ncbi:hypothetical protein [Metamycoplasma equirhinis]|uniref:hypothetical protein n=1 Tax=Metamycoplasma equirhinis TaxID=92402 RepID=UPI0025746E5B|nr:hypothetical protein [Metamycoplasma equirhinis]BDX52596.1 hypothetical protein JPM7_2030 [Metamycoplasma equirhinis]
MEIQKLLEKEIAQALEDKPGQAGEYNFVGVKLTDLQNTNLLKHFVSKSLIMEASRDINIISSDAKSVKFSNLLGGTKRTKNTLGTGSFDKYTISKPITIDWDEPFVYAEGLPAYAVNNFPATVAEKLVKFIEQDSKDFERYGFEKLEKAAKENKKFKPIEINTTTATGEQLYEQIVKAADNITQLVDKKAGIDLIDANKIVIFARPDILTKISVYAMKGDHTSTSLGLGSYALGTLGGYTTYACPFLKETSVIITTTNSMANARKIIAANAGKIDNLSNDLGAYLETTGLSGITLDMIPTAIIHNAEK